jgi:hypothetical protein
MADCAACCPIPLLSLAPRRFLKSSDMVKRGSGEVSARRNDYVDTGATVHFRGLAQAVDEVL